MLNNSDELCAVTGGGGYLGFKLGMSLASHGYRVLLLDVVIPNVENISSKIKFVQVDIIDEQRMKECLCGVSCVFHMASYGMSGCEQLDATKIEVVNVIGTEVLISACKVNNVGRFVYTSTYNVIFGGKPIVNGDETLPYLPLQQHPDHYSRTKSVAEQFILAENGSSLSNGTQLKTCALRLAGVYGPGETRHLPRIVSYLERGLFRFTYGSADSLVEFVHADNVVSAHILAAHTLATSDDASGQAFFISDDKPINNFEFFKPLVVGLGYSFPKWHLPIYIVYYFAFLTEIVHQIIGQFYNFQPFLTRTEVYKTGVTHYFSNEKAKKILHYQPILQNDMSDVVRHFKALGRAKKASAASSYTLLVNIFVCLMIFTVLMSFLPIAL